MTFKFCWVYFSAILNYHCSMVATVQGETFTIPTNNPENCTFGEMRDRELNNTLKIFIADNSPYAFYVAAENRFKGIEVDLVEMIATRLHLTPAYVSQRTIDEGEIDCNRRNADIRIGGLEHHRYASDSQFTSTQPYLRDELVWCLSAAKPLPKWMNFYVVLRGYEFPTLAVISYYLSSLVVYGLSQYSYRPLNFHECHCVVFQIVLTMGPMYQGRTAVIRFFYALSAFSCQIINLTTMAYYGMFAVWPARWSQATNIAEMFDFRFQLSGDEYSRSYVKASALYPPSFLDQFRVCDDVDACLDELQWNDKLAVSVPKLHARNYPPMPFTQLVCFDDYEAIHTYFISMLVRKNHPALSDITKLTSEVFESGLIAKWTRDIQFNPKQNYELKVIPFQVAHLGCSLLCFMVALIFSVMAFCAETITHRRVIEPNPHNLWIFADFLINNDRYFLL